MVLRFTPTSRAAALMLLLCFRRASSYRSPVALGRCFGLRFSVDFLRDVLHDLASFVEVAERESVADFGAAPNEVGVAVGFHADVAKEVVDDDRKARRPAGGVEEAVAFFSQSGDLLVVPFGKWCRRRRADELVDSSYDLRIPR